MIDEFRKLSRCPKPSFEVVWVYVELGLLSDRISKLEEHLRSISEKDPSFFLYRWNLIRSTKDRRKLLDLLKSADILLYEKPYKRSINGKN